jgi:hypothetical protein
MWRLGFLNSKPVSAHAFRQRLLSVSTMRTAGEASGSE